jgi:hypothetical protein
MNAQELAEEETALRELKGQIERAHKRSLDATCPEEEAIQKAKFVTDEQLGYRQQVLNFYRRKLILERRREIDALH